MKNMSRLLRLLPVKQDVLVFESGLGKQYADSPRYIYEELIRRGDTRTKVWIHSGSMRPRDPETKIVKRLSPSYYYYVARAAFITTNQNLPFYLKRHRRATYVQTWHGTPLKRMQHDMVDQSGHRDDYLRRVEAATSQWTHLLSPSPYATRAFRSAFRGGLPPQRPIAGSGRRSGRRRGPSTLGDRA
jgi:CDP-glycerol glycerophosphotransferase